MRSHKILPRIPKVILFLTCLQISSAYAVDANQELMEKAEAAFTKGNYQEAEKLYSALANNDTITKTNPAAYFYNYATMLAKNENYGLAYALLLRAKKLNPMDSDIQHNLNFVKTKIAPQASAIRPSGFTMDFVPEFFKKYSIIFLAFALLLFSIDAFLLLQNSKFLLHYPMLSVSLFFVIFFVAIQSAKLTETGILLPKNNVLRSGPSTSFPELLSLSAGAHVRILEETNGWYKLSFFSTLDSTAKEVIGWAEQKTVLPLNSAFTPPSQSE